MRLADWPRRLDMAIEAARARPFAWGVHDCCTWAADAARAQTGRDPGAEFRGNYASERGALRIIRAHRDLEGLWNRFLGAPKPRAFAGRGDIVLVRHAGGIRIAGDEECVGVVDLTGARAACVGLDGLVFVPLGRALKAWTVG